MAAVLDVGEGALLSHHSAAAWWGLPGFNLQTLHVVRSHPLSRHLPRLAVVHYHRALPHGQGFLLEQVPVTSPALTRVERALDNAWAGNLLDGQTLHRLLDELGERGRKGIALMRELLAARPIDWVPPASGLERRVAR